MAQITAPEENSVSPKGRGRFWLDWLRHLLCVAALMWTGLANGQPFFFADSTNYIRAADVAVFLSSQQTLATVWTDRYRSDLPQDTNPSPATTREPSHISTANDVGAGLVMSGRSPFIGALMYLGWVTGWFWPFVIFQAIVAYLLILLMLRKFGLDNPRVTVSVVLLLATTTSLPTYNSLLLADGFAPFGILAFVLLALRGRLTRLELIFVTLVLAIFVVAHLTHLMMLCGMIAAAGAVHLLECYHIPRRAFATGGAMVLVAVLALQATTIATRAAIGRAPQLLPLLTARFYVDGPGRKFIDNGCDGGRFAVCHIPIVAPVNNAGWLFDTDPKVGAYMLASPEVRRRMGEEDVAFAWATLKAYPSEQVLASARNTLSQFIWIDYSGLNQGCMSRQGCWENLPPQVHAQFDQSLSGKNRWPQAQMNALLKVTVVSALIAIFVSTCVLAVRNRSTLIRFGLAVSIIFAAWLTCSLFGGAVADPQYRYQGRLAWLPVLMAAIAVLVAYRAAPATEGKKFRS